VHGTPVSLKTDKLWSHNLTLRTRLVDTAATPMLLKTVVAGKLHPETLATHRFALQDTAPAYDTFANAAAEQAIKVLLVHQ
jgi:alcohol dehydrogenase